MAATETKSSSDSPPMSPTSPTPSLASPEEEKDTISFKSNLQIFLKRQENELNKNLQFKKKLEEEEMEKRKEKVGTKGKNESDNRERRDVSEKCEAEHAEGDDEVFEDHTESKIKPATKEKTDKNRKKESVDKDKGNVSQKKEKDKGSINSQSVKDQTVMEKPLEKKKDKETEDVEVVVAEKVTPDKERTKEGTSPILSKEKEEEKMKKITPEREASKVLPEKKDICSEEKSSLNKTEDPPPSKAKDTSKEKIKTGKQEDNTKEENDNKLGSPLSRDDSTPSENASRKRKDSVEGPDIGQSKKQKHQGTLMKKGSSPFSLWKKYYFVLDGKLLMYYRSDSDYKGLAGAKGSLDLALLENVKIKKPGKTKAPFPFGLYMKNPKTVNLAAETTEDRERWMAILLGTKRHGTRLSGSDSALKAEDSPVQEAKHKKYATMPAGNMPPNAGDFSSDSESDDKKEEEEEEPKFIQPKKVTRVGIGLPIDIGAVKLKKVSENPNKVEKPTDPENPSSESEVFGVKLKKLSVGGTTTSDSNVEGKPNGTEKAVSSRRPSKQANIPLNKSPLLPHVDVETDQKSLSCKPSGTTERKRSPSPCIPLSKGVHAFISKSTEEVEEEKEKGSNELIVYTAESREILYSEDILSIDDDPAVEFLEALDEIQKSLENLEFPEKENLQELGNGEHQEIAEIPQVSVTLKENPEESEYEEFDKEFLRTIKESKNAELSQRESGKFNKENQTEMNESGSDGGDNIAERSDKELVANADKISETYPSESSESNSNPISSSLAKSREESNEEEVNKEFLKNVSNPPMVSEAGETQSSSEVVTSPSGRVPDHSRGRTSSNSSCKSDSENSEKKAGKFKLFQTKQSVSGDDEKQKDERKDSKGRERKKSSFSKFLPGKKNKVKKCKEGDEGLERSPSVSSSSGKENVECNKEQQILPNDEASLKQENLDHDENLTTTELKIPQISLSLDDSDSEYTKKVELRSRKHSEREEASGSTYCRLSYTSESEPPPLVPEKKGMRSMSPGHDVPQNNRPVTAQEHEVGIPIERKEDIKVDGVISLDQIDAILSAKDNREKRRRSGCHDSGEKTEGSFGRMSSVVSTTSIESDEPLPKFNFLSSASNRSSSGSSRNRDRCDDSDISSDTQTDSVRTTADTNEQELSVSLRQIPRLTESIHAGGRVSLTFPEYTVIEEDGTLTPDQVKSIVEARSENTPEKEEDEINDYFPVIGGGVKLRSRSPTKINSQSSEAGLRTSGINSLKAFLEENLEDSSSTRSGISRLGHSAAVEKLKRESAEES